VVRTVRVRLELEDASFKGSLRDDAAAMRSFDGEVKSVGKSAERTGVELKDTSTTTKKLGDDVKKSSRDVTDLGKAIDDTRKSLSDLGAEYQRTGKVELERYRNLTGELKKLEQAKRDLDRLDNNNGRGLFGGAIGTGLGAVSGGLSSGIGGLSPAVTTALVAGAVAASPAIGAAVSAGVLLGVGGGALALGIAMAAKDPRVQAAWHGLGEDAKKELTQASSALVDPLIAAADRFRATFVGRIGPDLANDFSTLAPAVSHLSAGLDGFAIRVMPGVNHVIQASAPLISQLGDDLPRLGEGIRFFLDRMADAGPGAQQFIGDLITLSTATLATTGAIVELLSKLYELSHIPGLGGLLQIATDAETSGDKLHKSFQYLNTDAGQTAESLSKVSDAAQRAGLGAQLSAQDFSALNSMMSQTSMTSDALAGSMVDKILGATMSLDQATLGFAEAQTRLSESIKENGRQLDIHTAKGQANREAILGAVQANIANYDALIRAGAGADVAAAAYNTNTAALEKQLRQAGLTQGEIDGLIGKYRAVPDRVNTQIAIEGLSKAISDLDETLRLINGLHSKTVYVDVVTSQVGGPVGAVSGGRVARANRYGGLYEHAAVGKLRDAAISSPIAPARYAYAEPATGGEAFIPKHGDISRSRSIWGYVGQNWLGMRPTMAGGTTVNNITIPIAAGMGTNGQELGRQIAEVLRPYIRSAGGGNVQVALGKRGA
jgi:hypothetical protein